MANALEQMKKREEENAFPSFDEWQQEKYGYVIKPSSDVSYTEMDEPEMVDEEMGETMKGWHRGVEQSQAMLYGTAMLLGKATDVDWLKDVGLEGYERNMEEATQYQANVGRLEDIESFGDAADWFFGSVGEAAPTMAEAIVSSVAGGMIGSATAGPAGGVAGATVGRTLLKKGIKEAVESLVQKGVERQVANTVVKKAIRKKVGQAAGLHGMTWALESGGMFGEDVERRGIEEANAGSAAMWGAASSALETIGAESTFVRKVFGDGGVKVLKEATRQERGV